MHTLLNYSKENRKEILWNNGLSCVLSENIEKVFLGLVSAGFGNVARAVPGSQLLFGMVEPDLRQICDEGFSGLLFEKAAEIGLA